MTKVCTKCHIEKALEDFPKRTGRPNGASWCKTCTAERDRLHYIANHEQCREQRNRYRKANRYWINPRDHAKAMIQRLWLHYWIITIMGGKCVHCRKTHDLGIDHRFENGKSHRIICGWKNGRESTPAQRVKYYRSILESGCVNLQVLCSSCNTGKSNRYRKAAIIDGQLLSWAILT